MKAKNNPFYSANLFGDNSEEKGTINAKLSKYSKAHTRATNMANYIRRAEDKQPSTTKTMYKLANDLDKCGHWLVFRDYYTINQNRLIAADFCKKHLLCPLCAIRRGAKYIQSYLPKYEQVVAENPTYKGVMITFTVANGDNLMERVNHLRNSLRKLMEQRSQYRNGKKGYSYTEMSNVEGGVYSIEVKRGENSGEWHPHIHMACLVSADVDQEQLRQEWKAITGDSHIVDVREFYSDVVDSFCEVFKYALKFSEMSYADNLEAFWKLTGARLVSSFGCLYGVKVPDNLEDDPLEDDLPYIDRFYKYIKYNKEYSLMKAVDHEGDVLHTDSSIENGYISSYLTKDNGVAVRFVPFSNNNVLTMSLQSDEDDGRRSDSALLDGSTARRRTKNGVRKRCKPVSDKKIVRTEAVKGLRFEPHYP